MVLIKDKKCSNIYWLIRFVGRLSMVCTNNWKHDAWDGVVGDRLPSWITFAMVTNADSPRNLWKKGISGSSRQVK